MNNVEDISNMGAKLESVGVNNSLGQVASDIKNVSDNAKTASLSGCGFLTFFRKLHNRRLQIYCFRPLLASPEVRLDIVP